MPFLNGSEVASLQPGAVAGVTAIAAASVKGSQPAPSGAFEAVRAYLSTVASGLGVAVNQNIPQTNPDQQNLHRDRFITLANAAATNYAAHARATFTGNAIEAGRIEAALKDFSNEMGSQFKALEQFHRAAHDPQEGLPPGEDFPSAAAELQKLARETHAMVKKLFEAMGLKL